MILVYSCFELERKDTFADNLFYPCMKQCSWAEQHSNASLAMKGLSGDLFERTSSATLGPGKQSVRYNYSHQKGLVKNVPVHIQQKGLVKNIPVHIQQKGLVKNMPVHIQQKGLVKNVPVHIQQKGLVKNVPVHIQQKGLVKNVPVHIQQK